MRALTASFRGKGPFRGNWRLLLFVLLTLLPLATTGCAQSHSNILVYDEPVGKAGVVFAADGAGNFQYASKHVRAVAEAEKTPIEVISFDWSHGLYRIVADQIDYEHAKNEGCRLAATVSKFRRSHPDTPVHLLGHSAGAMVVLCALEKLPENSVDHVVLLSPSVSVDYDLLPALRAVKHGMYHFYSHADRLYLGVAIGILGNSDRVGGPSSGRFGFRTPPPNLENAPLLAKLHQRAWRHYDNALGNDGGHYGNYQPDFVRVHVLPLLR